jgi:hypothetical protein
MYRRSSLLTASIMGNSISTLKLSKIRSFQAILVCVLLATTVNSKQFNANVCQTFLADTSSNTTYLLPGSSPNLVRLSYESCLIACGDEAGIFDHLVPRLNTWLLPVLFLLASAQYPSAAGSDQTWKKVWRKAVVGVETLAHILGDPVEYTYTLLSQVETWKECLELAWRLRRPVGDEGFQEYIPQTQNVAIILAAFERVLDHVSQRENAGKYFTSIVNTLRNPEGELAGEEMREEQWTAAIKYEAKIARNFVIVRTRQLAPAIFAIAFYAWQIIGAFVPAIGSSPNPSGGRVATALMLSWVVFVVLFGNTVGEVASRTAYADTIKKYLERRPLNLGWQGIPTDRVARAEIDQAIQASSSTTYYTGYCYFLARHNAPESAKNGLALNTKLQQDIWHRRHSPLLLRAIAHTPVFVAVGCALAVTSLPPTYFSVRQAFFCGVGIMYHIISPALTSCLRRWWSLRAVRWKNAGITLIMITIFVVNSCGLFFNNCRGWETIYPKGQGVVIYSKSDFDRNDRVIFPIIVSLCISAQITLCVVLSLMYSRGLEVMKLTESS